MSGEGGGGGRSIRVLSLFMRTGTFNYMAPEAFNPPLDHKVDIWSMGCLIIEMATAVAPWVELQMQQIMFAVVVDKKTPHVPDSVPAAKTVRHFFF